MALAAGLRIGPIEVDPPVVLAPMAGVTNVAFRALCREYGGGLFVSEMQSARAVVEGGAKVPGRLLFARNEQVRSVQLYGVDPATIAAATKRVIGEYGATHIDLNMGCPAPKVTRLGGGAALPVRRVLFARIVAAAVAAAGPVPVTVKMRMGLDDQTLTYLDSGLAAADAGAAAVALHARTAEQHYAGQADWSAIARLKNAVPGIPILGNGDIWEAGDALTMMAQTGCDGVVVGRGCLGRPWLFGELASAFAGESDIPQPPLGTVAETLRRHTELLVDFFDGDEDHACRDIRKHIGWYFKGYPVGGDIRSSLATVESLQQMDDLLGRLDWTLPYPGADAEGPRGRAGTPKRTSLPNGWLDSRELADTQRAEVAEAEIHNSGG